MIIHIRQRIIHLLVSLFTVLCLPSALATPLLSLTLQQTAFTVSPGSQVQVGGVITNRTSNSLASDELILNFSEFDFTALTPSQLLGSDAFSLAPFTFSSEVPLFTIDIDPLAAGKYTLLVTLQDIAGNFSDPTMIALDVGLPNGEVPEPPTLFLLILALCLMSRLPHERSV